MISTVNEEPIPQSEADHPCQRGNMSSSMLATGPEQQEQGHQQEGKCRSVNNSQLNQNARESNDSEGKLYDCSWWKPLNGTDHDINTHPIELDPNVRVSDTTLRLLARIPDIERYKYFLCYDTIDGCPFYEYLPVPEVFYSTIE